MAQVHFLGTFARGVFGGIVMPTYRSTILCCGLQLQTYRLRSTLFLRISLFNTRDAVIHYPITQTYGLRPFLFLRVGLFVQMKQHVSRISTSSTSLYGLQAQTYCLRSFLFLGVGLGTKVYISSNVYVQYVSTGPLYIIFMSFTIG